MVQSIVGLCRYSQISYHNPSALMATTCAETVGSFLCEQPDELSIVRIALTHHPDPLG